MRYLLEYGLACVVSMYRLRVSNMQQTVDYTNNRVSPATVELLIRERSKGKSLRQLLAKYDPPPVTLLPASMPSLLLNY